MGRKRKVMRPWRRDGDLPPCHRPRETMEGAGSAGGVFTPCLPSHQLPFLTFLGGTQGKGIQREGAHGIGWRVQWGGGVGALVA